MMASVIEREKAPTAQKGRRPADVMGAAGGAAFVILILVGNGVAEDGGNKALGVPVELLGYVALACFIAYVATTLRSSLTWSPVLAAVAGITTIAVKVGSGAEYLAAEYAGVGEEIAASLTATNDAAFVINWLPHGLFVVAVALAAMHAGRLHAAVGWTGVVIGAATMAAITLSTSEPFVVPFLLSLLWLLTASVLLVRSELRGDRAWQVEV
jgi:hypothetical protein